MQLTNLKLLNGLNDTKLIIAKHIEEIGVTSGKLNILEAGCGRGWPFRFTGFEIILTGVDMDDAALNARKTVGDIDVSILGDIRDVDLERQAFDVIYSRFVLEHIEGAVQVLDNFMRWVKPGGILILMFPDRESVYSFITRITPLFVHVLAKKYILGQKTAGQKGHGPYPTYSEKITSRTEINKYFASKGASIIEEYGFSDGRIPYIVRTLMKVVELFSLGSLKSDHSNLLLVVRG